MKKLTLLLFPILSFAQVGINCTTPSTTLDVMGDLKLNAPDTALFDSVLVIKNRKVYKVSLQSLMTDKYPHFVRSQSNPHYLLFNSTTSITNPTSPLTISALSFVSAGTWVSNTIYYSSWTNTSGSPLGINQTFTVTFRNQTCIYNP